MINLPGWRSSRMGRAPVAPIERLSSLFSIECGSNYPDIWSDWISLLLVGQDSKVRAHRLAFAANNSDIQLTDFLPECVSVEPKEFGRFDLIAPGGGESGTDKWALNLSHDALV